MRRPRLGACPDSGSADAARGPPARGAMRPLSVYAESPCDLPITAEEIHKVLAALGADLTTIFEEDG